MFAFNFYIIPYLQKLIVVDNKFIFNNYKMILCLASKRYLCFSYVFM